MTWSVQFWDIYIYTSLISYSKLLTSNNNETEIKFGLCNKRKNNDLNKHIFLYFIQDYQIHKKKSLHFIC